MKRRKATTSRRPIALLICVGLYILYFSVFSIQRYKTLYASYFDLGIMNQAVYNTFRAFQTFDLGRILEMTNTDGSGQITRIAIHNDLLLGFISIFYFIYSSPVTLLVLQSVVLGLGAIVAYLLTKHVLSAHRHNKIIGLVFALAWLFYVPMQRSNLYDFHAVVLATTSLIAMYYFWSVGKYRLSLLFFLFSIFSKEQVALTTFLFGLYTLLHEVRLTLLFGPVRYFHKIKYFVTRDRQNMRFALTVITVSIVWFVLSVFVIIPYFRGGHHFASSRYGEFGESPAKILEGIMKNPFTVLSRLVHNDTLRYLYFLTGSLGFLSFFSPVHLLIAAPEFAINLLSNSGNMRNIIYHYTAVIQPFVFISAIYGFRNVLGMNKRLADGKALVIFILIMTLGFSAIKSPMWYSREHEIHPFVYPQKEAMYVRPWARILQDEHIRVSTTGQLAPFFTNRRYFYIFSKYYPVADYVIIRPNEIYTYAEKDQLIPIYRRLMRDPDFKLIEKKDNFEVYKKI